MRIDTPSSYLDLFSRPAATVPAVADQSDALPDASGEPSTSRALVPLSPPNLPATTGATDLAPELAEAVADADTSGYDLRAISPRDMQELSLDLYAQGLLTFEDYAVLAFQPDRLFGVASSQHGLVKFIRELISPEVKDLTGCVINNY